MTPKAFCLARDLTQTAFGKLVGLEKPTISRLFNGIPLSVKSALKIEEKTRGAVTRADIRPDIFGAPKPKRRKKRRKATSDGAPQRVSVTETQGQPPSGSVWPPCA